MGEFYSRHLDLITFSSIYDAKSILDLYTDNINKIKFSESHIFFLLSAIIKNIFFLLSAIIKNKAKIK